MKKRNDPRKLVLNAETLRRLTQSELQPVVAGISLASVCYENGQPECLLTDVC